MEEDFKEWLENPVTEYFRKYLKDSAREEAELLAEDILQGVVIENSAQIKISTICSTLNRISEIDYEEIDTFYKKEE